MFQASLERRWEESRSHLSGFRNSVEGAATRVSRAVLLQVGRRGRCGGGCGRTTDTLCGLAD